MTRARSAGVVLGRPGSGLESAGWAVNGEVARIGRTGEVRTAALLDSLAARPGGPAVLHDLRIPGGSANVDHVVVTGSRVHVVDAKVWAPGVYWTWSGVTPSTSRCPSAFTPVATRTTAFTTRPCSRTFIVNASTATNTNGPASARGRVRNAVTCSSRSAAIRETCDLDSPSMPRDCTSLSIRRVDTPSS